MINVKKLERVLLDIQDETYKKYAVELQKRNNIVSFNEDFSSKTCLYVTDDYKRAQCAKKRGYAVLIYLHEGNKEMNFTGFRYFIEGFEDADDDYFYWVFSREKGLPWMIGEAQHVILREMIPEDTDALYALYEDKSVVEFMEDLPADREEERIYIRDYIDKVYNFFGFGMWLVEEKDTGEIIGRVGFQNYEEDWTAELGFLIKPEYQRQGFAYEACKIAVEYMQREYPEYRLIARCVQGNQKAINLCNKLGIEYLVVEKIPTTK